MPVWRQLFLSPPLTHRICGPRARSEESMALIEFFVCVEMKLPRKPQIDYRASRSPSFSGRCSA